MFKLGEYYEDEAREMAEYLKEAGMKVEVRTFTTSHLQVFNYLEGRLSEIRGEIDEGDYNRYVKYLEVLRKILAEGGITEENLRDRTIQELEPQIKADSKRLCDLVGYDIPEGEPDGGKEKFREMIADLLTTSQVLSFIDNVLERNSIKIGEPVGNRLDDPIVRILIDEDEEVDESGLLKTTTLFVVEPYAEIYIDELSAVLTEDLDEEFEEKYPEEYMRLIFLGILISDLAEPSQDKMDMESFSERCQMHIEEKGNIIELDASSASEELARSLEKSGILKIKGRSIKWKR